MCVRWQAKAILCHLVICAIVLMQTATFADEVVTRAAASSIHEKQPLPASAVEVIPDSPSNTDSSNNHSIPQKDSVRLSHAPESADPINFPARIFQVTLGLIVVLAAILGVSWFAKRYGRFPSIPTNKLRILASLPVGQRERIVLLQVGEDQLLLGVTAQAVHVLHKLDEPLPTVSESQKKEPVISFSRRLQGELNERVPQ